MRCFLLRVRGYNASERSPFVLALEIDAMARKPLTKPRKKASQERSRATVDVLVEATARVLVKEGFDRASTNRIAEQAGVSIGSLYQYFPSKEALVAALVERHIETMSEALEAEMHALVDAPLDLCIRRMVTLMLD